MPMPGRVGAREVLKALDGLVHAIEVPCLAVRTGER